MRGHNICFCLEIRKIIFELSSIALLISSGALFYRSVRQSRLFATMRTTYAVREILQPDYTAGVDESQTAETDRPLKLNCF